MLVWIPSRCFAAVLAGFLLAAGGLEGQAPGEEAVEASASQLGPSPESVELRPAVSASMTRATAPALTAVASAAQPRRGAVPLMGAGAALLVSGGIIGGDAGTALMVGGAGALAWGVYLYL